MPFLAKVAGPLIGAGGGILASLLGKSGPSKEQKAQQAQTQQALMQVMQQQNNRSSQMFQQGTPLIGQGSGYVSQGADYFKDLLGGGSGLDKALAGPISDLKTGSQAQLQNISKFAPRGNIAGQMANRSSDLGAGIARLRYGAQSGAAGNLANIGSGLIGQGANLESGGQQGVQGVLSTLLGMSGQQNTSNMQQAGFGQDNSLAMGKGIGNLLSTLGGLFNNKPSNSDPISKPW